MEKSKRHFKVSENVFIATMTGLILAAVIIITYLEWKGRTGQ